MHMVQKGICFPMTRYVLTFVVSKIPRKDTDSCIDSARQVRHNNSQHISFSRFGKKKDGFSKDGVER